MNKNFKAGLIILVHVMRNSEELPRLYFHGCNVAAGDVGDEFITKLGRMTGAIIAASVKVKNCQVINQSVSDPK